MVFSIGSMFDLAPTAEERRYAGHSDADQDTNEWGSDAERYFQLARAAMATGISIVEQPTMSGVRALVRRLYIGFNFFTNSHPPASSLWHSTICCWIQINPRKMCTPSLPSQSAWPLV